MKDKLFLLCSKQNEIQVSQGTKTDLCSVLSEIVKIRENTDPLILFIIYVSAQGLAVPILFSTLTP